MTSPKADTSSDANLGPSKQGEIESKDLYIAVLALLSILIYLVGKYGHLIPYEFQDVPLYVSFFLGGVPLVADLLQKAMRREFGSDLLAGISILTSLVLGENLAGVLVILMLSGGEALEMYAVIRASSVLQALAKRMPSIAHRKTDQSIKDVPLNEIQIGDELIVFPHETCPVDGMVVEGHSEMDESFLTGEPFDISKTPGSYVISGAINGDAALTIKAVRLAQDSRFAKIVKVLEASEQNRPRIRRLGDQLGALYTPLAVFIALMAWIISGEASRFLAVLVIATPCPLLIAIPVAIIGSVSLAAKRGIIIKNPAALEQVHLCKTIILDKTGTLTSGRPYLTEQDCKAADRRHVLQIVASLERYSKHPLAVAIRDAAKKENLNFFDVSTISEKPGEGLSGLVQGTKAVITSRKNLEKTNSAVVAELPASVAGLECVILLNDKYAATYRFRDKARSDSKYFIEHLSTIHKFDKIMIVSGDRESEVRYLADQVGVTEVYADRSPEEKVEIVSTEMKNAKTLFIGDGINDAPALVLATVGVAFGQHSDVTSEAADAVIMDSSLARVDEFFHISSRMRKIALQSAVGGIVLSLVGMFFAAGGALTPVAGAVAQELIDLVSVLNALRVGMPRRQLADLSDT